MNIDIHSHSVPSAIAIGQGEISWHGAVVQAEADGRLRFDVGGNRGRLAWKNFRQTPEERIAVLDQLGVDRQFLSMSPVLWFYQAEPADALAGAREYNDEIAAICRRYPDRFGGLAWLPLQDAGASVEELERCMAAGLSGVSVASHVNGENWDSARLFPVMQAAERNGAIVFIHPAQVRVRELIPKFHMRNIFGNPWEVTVAAGSLVFGGVLDRLPDLKVVLAHGGGYVSFAMGRMDHAHEVRPEAQEFISQAPSDYVRHFFYDTITHSEDALAYLIDRVGVKQVVMGTDYPADMATSRPVEAINAVAQLNEEEKRLILGENVLRLLGQD
jgi:aminocarboxymuconate-semialdehyde decarboxylase